MRAGSDVRADPYVQGTTRLLDSAHPLNAVKAFNTRTTYPVDEYSGSSTVHESIYSWLPSLFSITEEGRVRIDSPVNGLGPRSEHAALYKALERIFELALPQIEESMFFEWAYERSRSYGRWEVRAPEREARDVGKWRARIEQQQGEKVREEAARVEWERRVREEQEQEVRGMPLGGIGKSRFAGKTLKVIVKAANYVLLPGQEYEGSWHVEGAPHEHIRASLIYYHSCSPSISDAGLSFRRLRTEEDDPNVARGHGDQFMIWDEEADDGIMDYPSDVEEGERAAYPYELPRNIELGTVPATGVTAEVEGTGRMLSFPNWLQHKVAGLKNTATEGNEPAVRKILCFFVVNESYPSADEHGQLNFPGFFHSGAHIGPNAAPLPTTADILPQQRFRIFPYVYNALDMACRRATGAGLPVELAIDICEMARVGMRRADAERHRRRLMDDRRAAVDEVNEVWEEDYGLCEH
ncbi:hypothetical protein CALVIDRAFT_27422 [Calocera viscosa TUFC12733]|uniref:DUF4246 domain-containing protein n=1 Tax=Calocera viscosa (strain TUFC12733) TaxID=1330018 RepID=A0A167P9D8_CALVF|nr:hypothetical protein CALVIDRAFT_27422 [Calocera viscosa TUFC12733]